MSIFADESSGTPAQRCDALAEMLASTARQELTPKLRPLLPDARRAAVAAYWLAQIADLGQFGKNFASALRREST